MGYFTLWPCVSSMSCAHLLCCVTGSTLSPIILQLRFAKSGSSPAMYPSSVVHTGVKSLGCENRMAQPSPIHSWKLILPCEVSAVKLGASSLIRNMRLSPEVCALAPRLEILVPMFQVANNVSSRPFRSTYSQIIPCSRHRHKIGVTGQFPITRASSTGRRNTLLDADLTATRQQSSFHL